MGGICAAAVLMLAPFSRYAMERPTPSDGAVADSGPQRIQNRAGITHGGLVDSSEGGALPRYRVVEKISTGSVGSKRKRRELSGLAYGNTVHGFQYQR